MENNFNNLWLLRGNPGDIRRIEEFKRDGIIAIGWGKLQNIKNDNKETIISKLTQCGYTTSNVTVGVINHFVNNMKVGDICLIPDDNKIYIAKIDSDYFYDETKKEEDYPHQRKITFLNIDDPLDRYDLPEDLQKSLGARNTVANLTHRKELFCNFMNNGDMGENDTSNIANILKNELMELLPKALENIKNDLESDDSARRSAASVEVIKLIQNLK